MRGLVLGRRCSCGNAAIHAPARSSASHASISASVMPSRASCTLVSGMGRRSYHCGARGVRSGWEDLFVSSKLRLMYEANPMAFIVEQAGGAATTGRDASSTSADRAASAHAGVPRIEERSRNFDPLSPGGGCRWLIRTSSRSTTARSTRDVCRALIAALRGERPGARAARPAAASISTLKDSWDIRSAGRAGMGRRGTGAQHRRARAGSSLPAQLRARGAGAAAAADARSGDRRARHARRRTRRDARRRRARPADLSRVPARQHQPAEVRRRPGRVSVLALRAVSDAADNGETLHRVLLWTIYLNDGFDEGETEFLYQQPQDRAARPARC